MNKKEGANQFSFIASDNAENLAGCSANDMPMQHQGHSCFSIFRTVFM